MIILLDTHTFLWFVEGSSRLSDRARQTLADPTNTRMLSVASLWEIAIKLSQDRLRFDAPFGPWVDDAIAQTEIGTLGITVQHMMEVSTFPFHHRDPFDRMIAAQAIVERWPILSIDKAFDAYPVTRIW